MKQDKTIQNIQAFTQKPLECLKSAPWNVTRSPQSFGKVAVLFGGRSAERAVSIESGTACLEALRRKGVDAHPIDPNEELAAKLSTGGFDRAFIMLHGTEGEDGVMQGLLQMMDIPFTGSGVAASALSMNKSRSKLIFHALDIPTPTFGVAQHINQAKDLAQKIGLPLSVKPVNEGSSLGVTRVDSMSQLKNAFMRAARYGEVMIERWIEGDDYFVSILGDDVLPPVQVRTSNSFYDYNAKYESDKTQYLCPAPLSSKEDEQLKEISYQAFKALGCQGWGRVDIMRDKQGQFWVLEVNTVPGMTSHSLVPLSAKAQGMSFDDLVMAILATSLADNQISVGNLAQK